MSTHFGGKMDKCRSEKVRIKGNINGSFYWILLFICINHITSSIASSNEESLYYVNIKTLNNSSSPINLLNSSPHLSSDHFLSDHLSSSNSLSQSNHNSFNNILDRQNVTKYSSKTSANDVKSCKDIILHPVLYEELCECVRDSSTTVRIDCDEIPILIEHSLIINPFISVSKYSQRNAGVHLLDGALFLTNDNDQMQLNAIDLSNNNLKKIGRLFDGVESNLEHLVLHHNLLGDHLNPITSHQIALRNLKSLNLGYNDLRNLDSNIFAGLNQLNDLNLEGNYLMDIPSSSLRALDRLVKMSIGNNMITRLENSSLPRSLESLMYLNLTYNRIQHIQPESFVHLNALTELYMSNNLLTRLKINVGLDELEILDISENQFESIPNEMKLKKLRKLSLSGNRITTIDENDFNQMTRLEYVDLSRNLIRSVSSQAFQYLSDLRVLNLATNYLNKQSDLNFNLLRNQLQLDILDLSDNRLYTFPFQLLINQKNLRKLFLDYNQIDKLTHEMLQSLESLEELSISFNLLSELNDGLFFYNSKLKLINLHGNRIQNVNDNVFIGCSDNLLGLDLSYNDIQILPRLILPKLIIINLSLNSFRELTRDHFINLPSLIYLNLSNAITGDANIIPASIFHYNRQLEFLDLSHNELELIEIGAFRNLSLKRIDLSNNKIKELDTATFEELSDLEHLDVSSNELIYIKNGAFYELPRLKTLNLSKNLLQSFRGELFSVTRTQLELLDLCHNSLNYLYPSSFNVHRKLKVLKLCANNLNYFPTEHINTITSLEEIDLSSNKLKSLDTNNFANLPKLRELKLNNNYLDTIGTNAFYNLSKLTHLDLSGNHLVDMDANAFQRILRLHLNLANNQLQTLDSGLFELENVAILVELNLAANNLTDFPLDALRRQATSLISLDISSNHISYLPTNTDLLTNLKQLDISSNPLSDDAIRVLFTEPKAIKHLNVAHSIRSGLKFDTIETPFIRHLNLSGNQLRSLNSSLFEKINLLEVLDLSHNFFADIGLFAEVWPLISKLRKLNLSFNPLKRIQKEHFTGLNNLVALDLISLSDLISLDCESIARLGYLSELAIYNYTMLKNYEPQECFMNNNRLTRLSIEIKSAELKGHLSGAYSTKLNQLMIYGPKLSKVSNNFLYGIRSKQLEFTLFNTSLSELSLRVFNALSLKCAIQFNLVSSSELLLTNNNLNEMNSKLLNVRINRLSNVSLPCDCSIETIYKMMNTKNQFTLNGQRKSIFLNSLIGQFDELACNQPAILVGSKLSEIDFNEVICLENTSEQTNGTNGSDNNYSLIKDENRIDKTDLVELSTSESIAYENRTSTTSNYNLNSNLNNQFTVDRMINSSTHYPHSQNSDISGVLLTRSSLRKNKNNLKLKSNELKSNQVLLSSLSFTKIDTIIIGSTLATVLFILILMIVCCFGMRIKTQPYVDSSYMNYGNLFGQPLTVRNQSSLESNCTCMKSSPHQTNHSPYSSSLNNSLLNFSPVYQQNDNLEPMTMFYMK